ncbi:MAG: carboxymuconolactone decarboxylase family protein [Acidimicrobiales bacterium]
MTRLDPITEDDLDERQRAFLDQINQGDRARRHGRLGLVGPFGVWARAPHVGEPAQRLGATLRFGTSLPDPVVEAAVCTVGAHHRARFEFAAHRRLGLAAGLSEASLDRLQAGEDPGFEGDEAVAHTVATELTAGSRLTSATYARAVEAFGEAGLIELVTLVGYYGLISFTLNAFDIELEDGMVDPFPDD